MKSVSRGQIIEVVSRIGTQVDWDSLDGIRLQEEVINLSPGEFGRRFTAFILSGAKLNTDNLKVPIIPLFAAKFVGKGWAFWRGPKNGNGLEGEEEYDKKSMVPTEVDFDKVDFLTCLERDEVSIAGEEKLIRLRKLGRTLFNANIFASLWQDYRSCQDKDNSVLEKLYQQKNIGHVDFFGDILRSPNGDRYVLCLYRTSVDGLWRWGYNCLDCDWNGSDLSAVSR